MAIAPIGSLPVSTLPSLPDLGGIGSSASSPGAAPAPGAPGSAEQSFGQLISDEIGKVEQTQQQASIAQANLASGRTNDISSVAIATQKATLALDLATTVRTKIIDAYTEIMRTQL